MSGAPRLGTLILIVGPSGSGKDTLLDAAKAHFQDVSSLRFSQRIITRRDQIGEEHEFVSDADFARIEQEGGFFLAWQAHDLHYGIAIGVLEDLGTGQTVIVNTSRKAIAEAREKWPHVHVIYVDAHEDVRRARLQKRGREAGGNIDQRVRRGEALDLPNAPWLTRVDNSGALADGIERFIAAITEAVNA